MICPRCGFRMQSYAAENVGGYRDVRNCEVRDAMAQYDLSRGPSSNYSTSYSASPSYTGKSGRKYK